MAESSRVGVIDELVALTSDLVEWLLDRLPVMLPIPATSSLAHLEENTAVASG